MSVLIKGMEMPTSCADCRLMADGWCYSVGLEQREKKSTVKRPTWCPLVPVPPHGRLIDADALLELIGFEVRHYVVKDDFDKGRVAAWNNVIHVIREYAPTIIPASEEDVKTEEDSEPWLCLSCRNYPPSSTDGKPCTHCDPREVLHSCYDPVEEEGET